MDDNPDLYLLLRVAAWDERKRLKGSVSGALWIRHMAELIRRAFGEAHGQRWPEEDEAFGHWPAGAREMSFGSERPLDDVLAAKPYLSWTFGLFTGSALRWYVEGDTEFYAVLELLSDASKFGVELVNLKGAIASGRDNAALKLESSLRQDRLLRRFSMISFDRDVQENVKAIQRQIEQENIVGFIAASNPDYEFANFSVTELTEIAASINEACGYSGDPVRNADWTSIANGKEFEQKYRKVSARKSAVLKCEQWGRALARYALGHPYRSDGSERALWREVRRALHAWQSNYDHQCEDFTFDRQTFKLVRKPVTPNR